MLDKCHSPDQISTPYFLLKFKGCLLDITEHVAHHSVTKLSLHSSIRLGILKKIRVLIGVVE